MLRFRNGKIKTNKKDIYSDIKLFINLGSDEELDESNPNYLGTFRRLPNEVPTILFFDITEKAKSILGNRASFTVVYSSAEGSFEWGSAELTVFKKEIL